MVTVVAVCQDSLVVDVKQVRSFLYLPTMCLCVHNYQRLSSIACVTSISELVLSFSALYIVQSLDINDFSSIPCVTIITELVLVFSALLSLS